MPHRNLIQVLHPNEPEIKSYSPQEFESVMQLKFIPNLAFPEGKVFDKVSKRCKKALKKEYFEKRQKWLGVLFGEEIERGSSPDVLIKWIDEHVGWGVFAATDLPPFTYVGEYTGNVRRRRFSDRKNSYCFDYSIGEGRRSPFIIDAEKQGNITRFINHSQTPNLEPVSVFSGDLMHVILLTTRWIKKGEQLTYDYGADYWKKRKEPVTFS